jgi:hypothetical protein
MANQPDTYNLSGYGIHASYSTTSISGKPLFSYHDAVQSKNFSGDEVRTVDTEIGKLVTVTIHMTIDQGSTTFSLLLPRVVLPASNHVSIAAEGVTTLNRFSVHPMPGEAQFYTVHKMQGTATFVVP